jgi:hypothetical protein
MHANRPAHLNLHCLITLTILQDIYGLLISLLPVTVAERSKACIVFARSEARIVGSNPIQGMDIWCVYVFIMCLCCPVFR